MKGKFAWQQKRGQMLKLSKGKNEWMNKWVNEDKSTNVEKRSITAASISK